MASPVHAEVAGLIDLSLWETDRPALVAAVAAAARDTGFLQVVNHGVPQSVIDAAFAASASYFALPDSTKGQTPFRGWAGGWEKEQQVRPSTGTADVKESFQIGYTAAAEASWPGEETLPGFRATCASFMAHAARVSDTLLRALALALDWPEETLSAVHQPSLEDVQSVLRLLHYPPLVGRDAEVAGRWRAGAHTDFDVLTLLFQRPGQGGLEACPGRKASTEFASGDSGWVAVPPLQGAITCNIGDMLMRWSDDQLVSTFHRVRAPELGSEDASRSRYSIAYFNQACASTVIGGGGKSGKYAPLTGREFLQEAIQRNFSALADRRTAALWAAPPTLDFDAAFPPGCAVAAGPPTAAQLALARQLDEVCRVHGFCRLKCDVAGLGAAFAASRALFGLSEAEKAGLCRVDRAAGTNTGYAPLQSEALNSARANDAKEAYGVRNHSMNWAGVPAGFQASTEQFYQSAAELSERIMVACALALHLPPSFFVERHQRRDLCTLRLLHYPGGEGGAEEQPGARIRCGEHTDYGMVSLVFIDAAQTGGEDGGGLQVKRPDGRWLDVPAQPGTVVVNTGGLLAQWTNDAWVATPHRVVAPPGPSPARFSIAYFVDPDSEVLVECLPAFCGPDRPSLYPPITSAAYLLGKLAAAQQRPSG